MATACEARDALLQDTADPLMTSPTSTTTAPADINPHALTAEAFRIVVADLESYGNVLSPMHRAALLELVETFTGYCTGHTQGRLAFPLPTGCGKTSAVVAFIAALHRLGYLVPVAVAASKVDALCSIKEDLMAHGVPEHLIGLKHAVPDARLPSTGNQSRPFMLITHTRVRSGRDFELFGHHQGTPRALLIYDETMLRCDAFTVDALALRRAIAVCTVEAEEGAKSATSAALVGYLRGASEVITAALARLRETGDPNGNGAPIELPFREEHEIAAYRAEVSAMGRALRGFASEIDSLLVLSQEPLRVLSTEQGGGAVGAREAVPPELRNVVILDASTPIRELARLDPTVRPVESFNLADLKSFERVQVHQLFAHGGRHSVEDGFNARGYGASPMGQEVAAIIRERWQEPGSALVFSFLKQGGAGRVDPLAELRRDLGRECIDLAARVTVERPGGPQERPKVEFLTWGSETSTNGFEHCSTVIMAGVLHRHQLDLASLARGQVGNPAEPTPSARLRDLVRSEAAHCIYQGASRGSSRRVDNGKALPMHLYVIHADPLLRETLERVMPGAAWSYPEPRFLRKATTTSAEVEMLGKVLALLRSLPPTQDRITKKALKKALDLDQSKATAQLFTKAGARIDPTLHGWEAVGQWVERRTVEAP